MIGDPIELDDLVKENTEFSSKSELYDAIAVRVGQRMQVMKEELDQLVAAREIQLAAEEAQRLHSVEKAQNLLQYVDWEAQGHLPESDSIVKEHYLDLSLMRNSDAYAQISGAQEQLPRGKLLSWSSFVRMSLAHFVFLMTSCLSGQIVQHSSAIFCVDIYLFLWLASVYRGANKHETRADCFRAEDF